MDIKALRIAVPLIASLMLVSACGGASNSTSATTSGKAVEEQSSATPSEAVTLGFSSPVASQPSLALLADGMKTAAGSIGWDVNVLDANLNPNQQVSNIQTMIQQKVGAIGSWTLDAGATAGIYGDADAAGIPVIGINSEGTGVKYTVWSEIQQCQPGGTAEQTAKFIASKYPHGTVFTIGLDVVPSWVAVQECFDNAAKAAGLTIVAHQSNNTDDSAGAQKLVSDMLLKYPDVNAIWAYNDASALGASAAVIGSGLAVSDGQSDGVMIVGENGDADAIQAVREGRLTGTWDLNMVELGWLFVKTAREAIETGSAPAKSILRSTFVTAQNINEYVVPSERQVNFDSLDLVQ